MHLNVNSAQFKSFLFKAGFAIFAVVSARFCGCKIVRFMMVFGFCGFAVFNTNLIQAIFH